MVDCMQIPEGCGYVRTVVASSRGGADGLLYVGTTKNSVLHGSLQDKMATVIHVSTLQL